MSKKALRAYQHGGRSSNEALRATRVDRCLILGAYDRSNQGSRERDAISFKWLGICASVIRSDLHSGIVLERQV